MISNSNTEDDTASL